MPPYGISYAAGALSQAIGDMFKGMGEGQEERRKEEELGIRKRAAITEEAYAPIRFEQGRLANQATQQGMDLAKLQEERQAAQERRTQEAFGPEQQTRLLDVAIKRRAEEFQERQIKADLATAELNQRRLAQELKEAEVRYPGLVDQLKRDAETADINLRELRRKDALNETRRARRDQAGAAILAAGLDEKKLVAALSQFGDDIDPDDPALKAIDWALRYRATLAGQTESKKPNPIQVYNAKKGAQNAAADDAVRDAKLSMLRAYGETAVKTQEEPGLMESEAWFQQYHRGRRLRMSEDPNVDVVFTDAEKQIDPMPKHLIERLADNTGMKSWIGGSTAGHQESLDRYSRMNAYLTQGYEWGQAELLANRDRVLFNQGKPTPSDQFRYEQTVKPAGGQSWYEKGWQNIQESFSGPSVPPTGMPGPAPGSTPVTITPPSAPTGPSTAPTGRPSPADPAAVKAQRLEELSRSETGKPWSDMLHSVNREWKVYLESLYERKYGEKP